MLLSRNLTGEFLAYKCSAGEPETIYIVSDAICEMQLGKAQFKLYLILLGTIWLIETEAILFSFVRPPIAYS